MKKIILIISIIMCLVLTLSFAACESANDNTGDKGTGARIPDVTFKVMAPDGAPALALAKMMMDEPINGLKLDYSIIDSTTVAANMTNGDADFIIAPTNAGVMQSVNTGAYYLLGVTSWGNLYIVTTNDDYLTLEDSADAGAFLAQFSGNSISTIGSNQVPDKSLKHLLNLSEVTCTVASAQTAAVIQNDLIAGTIDAAVLGEPAVTGTKALLAKNGVTNYRILGSISAVWTALTGLEYPQAAVFVKKSIADAYPIVIEAFTDALDKSIEYLNASAEHAEELGTYMEGRGDNSLKAAIIKQCYLRTAQGYRSAADSKDAVKQLVGVLVPSLANQDYDDVFYQAK